MCIQSMNRHPVAQGGFTFADSVNDEYFLYNQLQERMEHFNKLSDDDSDLSMLQNLTSKMAKMFKLGSLVLKTANANFIVPFKTARKQLPDILLSPCFFYWSWAAIHLLIHFVILDSHSSGLK